MMYLDIAEQITNEERKKRKYNNLLDKINSTESKINNVVFPKREDMPNVDVSCCPQDLINSRMEFVTDDVKWLIERVPQIKECLEKIIISKGASENDKK